MDVMQPQLYWIDGRCYRRNPTAFDRAEGPADPSGGSYNYAEADDYEDETCESDVPVEKLPDGRFRTALTIPSEFYPRIIGRSGENKSKMEKETRTTINIPRKGQTGDIVITGCDHRGVVAAHSQLALLAATIRKRQPFTHFVSVPLADAGLKTRYLQFQEDVLGRCQRGSGVDHELFQKASKLHLTIGTLVLLNDRERQKAADTLLACKPAIMDLVGRQGLTVQIRGVEYMNDDPACVDVLYGRCVDDDHGQRFQRIADLLVDAFVDAGLMERRAATAASAGVKLHATLMNSLFKVDADDDDAVRPTCDARSILDEFRDYPFGTQRIDQVHLSQRYSTCPSTGYYVATARLQLDEKR